MGNWLRSDSTVVIKPNVCTTVAEFVVRGNTNPAVVRAVCEVAADIAWNYHALLCGTRS
jgi:uncharacterized protein (DUF362 family)